MNKKYQNEGKTKAHLIKINNKNQNLKKNVGKSCFLFPPFFVAEFLYDFRLLETFICYTFTLSQ